MAHPTGESKDGVLKLDFDRRLMLEFRGSVVTSDAGLLAYRALDDALGLTTIAGETLADARTGKNGRHALVGLLRQSVFGRLAGYDDVNDAERLRHDPASTAHGLRKAAARRLAEAGCTMHEIAAITGHASLSEVQRYTRAADQARLARAAMDKAK